MILDYYIFMLALCAGILGALLAGGIAKLFRLSSALRTTAVFIGGGALFVISYLSIWLRFLA